MNAPIDASDEVKREACRLFDSNMITRDELLERLGFPTNQARIALTTSWNEAYDAIAEVTTPLMYAYCLRNGYNFVPYKGKFHLDMALDPSLLTYGDRCKIQLYKDLYYQYDLVVWMDVDTVITNIDVRMEDIIDDRPFLWTYGPSGPLSGFTMARTIPEVHCALHAVQHRAAEDASPLAPGGRSDQDTMRFFMPVPPYDRIFGGRNLVSCKTAGHCMPFDRFGWSPRYSYLGDWEPGDFLWTIPSVPIEERLALLREKRIEIYGE